MEEKRIAKNGIEIYGYKNEALHGFFISLFLRGGSMYESEKDNGITHFFEHIAIRNVNKLMDGRLYAELDKHGVEFNASTFAEMVQFYVSGASANFKFASEVLTKVLSPIVISKSECDSERKRIKAEIRESDDRNSLSAFSNENVHQKTSLARSILGTNKTVDAITVKRLEEYRSSVFTKENVFLYVSGNYTEDDMSHLVGLVGSHAVKEGNAHDNVAPVPQSFSNRNAAVYVKNADFTAIRFAFDIDMSKHSVPRTDLIYDMLLSGYNSAFFIEMSEVRGLFYDVSGAVERYRNIGTLHFTYEVKEKDLALATSITVDILNKFKNELVSEDECMKPGYVSNSGMLFDDVREFNFTMAYDNHIMRLGYNGLGERTAAYQSVTPLQIRDAARDIFTAKNLTVSIKGNKKKINVSEISDILSRLG